MEEKQYKLSESEYRLMTLVWDQEPLTSMELARLGYSAYGWKKSTVYTILKKLCDKGTLENRETMVRALVRREQVQQYESRTVVEKTFGGSLPGFVAAFLKDRRLTMEEAKELEELIRRSVGKDGDLR